MVKTSRSDSSAPLKKKGPQKETETFSRAQIEKIIRSRSRVTTERILDAAGYAGNRGWFVLTLRLLEGAPIGSLNNAHAFRHRWLLAQAYAAVNDFSAALEALEAVSNEQPDQSFATKSFELVLQLSLSEWQKAMDIGFELLQSQTLATEPFARARLEILYAVAVLHGEGDRQEVVRYLRSAEARLQGETLRPLQRRSLMRQVELFLGQERYLAGDFERASEYFQIGLKHEPKEEGQSEIYPNLFEAWLLLSRLKFALKEGVIELRPLLEEYDRVITRFCALDPTPVTAQLEGHFAIALQDVDLARQLWLGTIYPGFRVWLEKHFRQVFFAKANPVSVYIIPKGQGASQSQHYKRRGEVEVDAWTGVVSDRERGVVTQLRIKPGQALQRLLETMTLSRYAGLTVVEIHRRIFPDEHFHPRASPAKIRTLIYRLRKELASAKIGLRLTEVKDRYELVADRPIEIRIRWMMSRELQEEVRPTFQPMTPSGEKPDPEKANPLRQQVYRKLVLLKEHFAGEAFSLDQALPVLRLKRSRATQVLRIAIEQHWVERILLNRSVRYRCLIG